MDTIDRPTELTQRYFLTAGETDARGEMPLWLVFSRAIEVATLHANILGIGYDRLITLGIGWVLTRFSVEMKRYPRINDSYSITTWIEGFNRLYSDRCFLIADAEGNEIGHIRTMWVAIDMVKRTAADLTAIETGGFPLGSRVCPVSRIGKQRPLPPQAAAVPYTFRYSDIDFNRHVNTVQYVKHILNLWSLEFFDSHKIDRFDITFHSECRYGQTVSIRSLETEPDRWLCEIIDPDGRQAVTAALTLSASTDINKPD